MRSRLLPLLLVMTTTTCIITNPTSYDPDPVLTPPRIRDLPGRTRPRLGNLISLRETDSSVVFEVPVDDSGLTDALAWRLFVNVERECRGLEAACLPSQQGIVAPNGAAQRVVEATLPESALAVGCNRVEVWVSSRFDSNNLHDPSQLGDIDFATWWVFKRPAGGADAGAVDPVESCAWRVIQ